MKTVDCIQMVMAIADEPVALECERATIFGSRREAHGYARRRAKAFGDVRGVVGIHRDDPRLSGVFITYQWHPNSPRRQRYEHRVKLKKQLGADRALVKHATARTQRDFLAWLDSDGRTALLVKLGMGPVDFWRAVRRAECQK